MSIKTNSQLQTNSTPDSNQEKASRAADSTKPIVKVAEGSKDPSAGNQQLPTINPEAVSKALKEYQKMREKLMNPAFKGAAGLFTDNIVFPNELLDPNNPVNDPRYLHLLLAMFGMKEMKQFFESEEQKEEQDREDEEADDQSEK